MGFQGTSGPINTLLGHYLTMLQVGQDVVVSGSGTLKTANAGLTYLGFGGSSSLVFPAGGKLAVGSTANIIGIFDGVTGPANYGPGLAVSATSGTGDPVLVASNAHLLCVPQGYMSGDPLTTSSTYANQTFASLGVTPGFYQWTWGGGPTGGGDRVTLTVQAVPEPGAVGLGLSAAGGPAAGGSASGTPAGERPV